MNRHRFLCNFGVDTAQTYSQQVQAIDDLIYYLPMTDPAGTTTLANQAAAKPAYQAAATNVTFGSTAGPINGETAADFNGSSSLVNLLSAGTFNADFNGNEYTISFYAKLTYDATARHIINFIGPNTQNLIYFRMPEFEAVTRNANITLRSRGPFDGTYLENAWFNIIIKISDSGDKAQWKVNSLLRMTDVGVGTWPAGNLTVARLGVDNGGTLFYNGSMAQFVVVNRFTTDEEDAILAGLTLETEESSLAKYVGAWTWFNDPRAIRSGTKTFIASLNTYIGSTQAAVYDHDTELLSGPYYLKTPFENDDHNNPALLIRDSDSKIIALYSKHNGTDIWQRVSSSALSVSAWAAETTLDASLGLSMYSYVNPIQLTGEVNDPIYLFTRASDGVDRQPHYSVSTDGGATWAAATKLLNSDGQRPYLKCVANGTARIDFCVTDGQPNEATNNSIYHFYYQGGNFYQSDGTLIKAVAALPLELAELTKVYDGSAATGEAWNWDIAIDGSGNPVIVYAVFPTAASDHRYRYAKWTGAAWADNQICTAGIPLYAAEAYYSGGAALDHSNVNIVYASRETGDGVHRLYKYVTADNGASWTEAQLTTEFAMRPVVVRGHDGTANLLYMTGYYYSYTSFSTRVKLITG